MQISNGPWEGQTLQPSKSWIGLFDLPENVCMPQGEGVNHTRYVAGRSSTGNLDDTSGWLGIQYGADECIMAKKRAAL